MFQFFVDEKYQEKISAEIIFSRVFSENTFHIIFDNVLLKDSIQISCYFINFTLLHAAQQMISSLKHLALSYLAFVFWSQSHESGGKYVPRICLAPRSVTSVIKKQTGKKTC